MDNQGNPDLPINSLSSGIRKVFSFANYLDRLPPGQPFNVALAVIVVTCIWSAAWLVERARGDLKFYSSAAALFVIALLSFFWFYRRFSRRTPVQRGSIPETLKGLSSYSEKDGGYFSKLERRTEIGRCTDFLNDPNNSIVVVFGPSGSGKTSLLRAGIQYELQKPPVASDSAQAPLRCIYWSAVDSDASSALADMVETSTGIPCNGNPATLLQWASARLVIIIDQFERLRRNNLQHKPIFDLIHGAFSQAPPHNLQLVIAFSVDYFPEWLDFQDEANVHAQKVAVGPFTVGRAAAVMKIILSKAGIVVNPVVISRYINDIADGGGVSPVGIAIGAMAFSTWDESGRGMPVQEYTIAGGAIGVLRAHVIERLGPAYVRSQDRDPLIRALMTTLVEAETELRVPQGASVELISDVALLDRGRVRTYVKGLEAGRILEAIPFTNVYVLSHDRLVRVLKELAQKITSKERVIVDRYLLWKKERKRRYLLRGLKLDWILTNINSFLVGPDANERVRYLRLSVRARTWRYCTVPMLLLVLFFCLGMAQHFRVISGFRRQLVDAHLPPDLYDRQDQFESLIIDQGELGTLDWFRPSELNDFRITSPTLHSLDGLKAASELRSLDIDLNKSTVNSLDAILRLHKLESLTLRHIGPAQAKLVPYFGGLKELKKLDLDFEGSQISALPDLAALQELESLTLNLKSTVISDLSELAKLQHLSSLVVLLDGSSVHNLGPLAKLDRLKNLGLSLDKTQIQYLTDLNGSQASFSLTLYSGFSPFTDFPDLSSIRRLHGLTIRMLGSKAGLSPNIARIKQLQELVISFNGSDTSALPDFAQLSGLDTLVLDLESTGIRKIPDFSSMQRLEHLTLNLNSTGIRELPDFTQLNKLKDLGLLLRESPIRSLHTIEHIKNLQTLTLDIRGALTVDISSIARTANLEKLILYLRWSQVRDLPDLSQITKLHILELHIEGYWNIEELPDLTHLQELEDLSLDLERSEIKSLPDLSRLPHLRRIALSLENSEIQDLSTLKGVSALEELSLDLKGAKIETLPDLTQLKNVRQAIADIRHSRIKDLVQTRNLFRLRELTVDQGYKSLKDLPETVKKLRFAH